MFPITNILDTTNESNFLSQYMSTSIEWELVGMGWVFLCTGSHVVEAPRGPLSMAFLCVKTPGCFHNMGASTHLTPHTHNNRQHLH